MTPEETVEFASGVPTGVVRAVGVLVVVAMAAFWKPNRHEHDLCSAQEGSVDLMQLPSPGFTDPAADLGEPEHPWYSG